MMRLSLLLAAAVFIGGAYGQVVQNGAAVNPVDGSFAFSYVGAVAAPNTIAPRMLATLSVSTPACGVPPIVQKASLSIRPANTVTEIPVGIVRLDGTASVTFVVPAGIPLGGAELLYRINDQPTQWTAVNVVQSSFELFRVTPGGPAKGNGLASPARPGQTIRLTGSGMGYGAAVSATVGGVAAPIVYAGPSTTQAGVDEISLQIPQSGSISDSCYTPLAVTVNGTTVNSSISVTADGSPCHHPFQFSDADLQVLDSRSQLATLSIDFSTALNSVTSDISSRTDNLSAIARNGGIGDFTRPNPPAAGTCSLAAAPVPLLGVIALSPRFAQSNLDIGASLTFAGNGSRFTVPLRSDGFSSGQTFNPTSDATPSNPASPAISPGKWTVSAGGGNLPASSADFTIPPPFQFADGIPGSLSIDKDQTILWNASGLDPAATVTLYLSDTANNRIACQAPAAGSVTIPAALLAAFRRNGMGTLFGATTTWLAAQWKLRTGDTLVVLFSCSSSDNRPVDFK